LNVIFSKPGGDVNRMDGTTPMGPTRPVLYTSLDTEAAAAEGIHYNPNARQSLDRPIINFSQIKERSSLWLPEKTVVTFKVVQPMLFFDIRRDNAEAMEFLQRMNQDQQVRTELRKAGYGHIIQALQDGRDYSASRGLAYGADVGIGLNGVIWNTARISQHADLFADNVSVKGDYLQPVSQLRPLMTQEYYKDQTSGELVYVVQAVDPTVKVSEVSPFPEGTEVSKTGNSGSTATPTGPTAT
jgi:hypothetical protein